MIRVLVSGAQGRMGRVACAAIRAAGNLELCGTCVRGQDLRAQIATAGAEVVVDFTVPEVVRQHADLILDAGARPVIGTSGLGEPDRQELAARCRELERGGLLAANFAVGAVLLMRLSRQAAGVFRDVEIIESHHPAKRDAPSATARATAALLGGGAAGAGASRGEILHGVPVHSVRLPGLIAEQEVRFGGPGQTLTLTHRTYSREAYAPGIVLACREVIHQRRLLLGLDELLFPAGA